MSIRFVDALNSFEGFRGAIIDDHPTNQAEFSALINAVDGGSCWSGTVPTFAEVAAKEAELDAEDAAEEALKDSGKQKLKDLGLTDDEIAKMMNA